MIGDNWSPLNEWVFEDPFWLDLIGVFACDIANFVLLILILTILELICGSLFKKTNVSLHIDTLNRLLCKQFRRSKGFFSCIIENYYLLKIRSGLGPNIFNIRLISVRFPLEIRLFDFGSLLISNINGYLGILCLGHGIIWKSWGQE